MGDQKGLLKKGHLSLTTLGRGNGMCVRTREDHTMLNTQNEGTWPQISLEPWAGVRWSRGLVAVLRNVAFIMSAVERY